MRENVSVSLDVRGFEKGEKYLIGARTSLSESDQRKVFKVSSYIDNQRQKPAREQGCKNFKF
jgi:hypothetical protein